MALVRNSGASSRHTRAYQQTPSTCASCRFRRVVSLRTVTGRDGATSAFIESTEPLVRIHQRFRENSLTGLNRSQRIGRAYHLQRSKSLPPFDFWQFTRLVAARQSFATSDHGPSARILTEP